MPVEVEDSARARSARLTDGYCFQLSLDVGKELADQNAERDDGRQD